MTTATRTLTSFLLERLAEDETAVRDAVDVGWVTFRQPDGSMGHTALGTPTEEGWLVDGRLVQDERAEVFYDPARVLAECAAKRAVVELHSGEAVHGCPAAPDDTMWVEGPCATLRALAAVYANHPAFREEWRP